MKKTCRFDALPCSHSESEGSTPREFPGDRDANSSAAWISGSLPPLAPLRHKQAITARLAEVVRGTNAYSPEISQVRAWACDALKHGRATRLGAALRPVRGVLKGSHGRVL